ncbi:MAG: DUF1998 domain-containing protein, partial [Chloroflexi bacterium]|nr:DUF1998 domain-containing protein [Chloroflexota bacterium]
MTKGELRISQLVTAFGPGAMLDLPDASVIIGGLDHWYYPDDMNLDIVKVEEARLLRKIQQSLPTITAMRKPPPAAEQSYTSQPNITAWQFPEWFIVQQAELTRGYRHRRLIHIRAVDGNRYRDLDGKKLNVVPVRFVRACQHGHIGDIDWKTFVHMGRTDCTRQLWLEERGTSGDLDSIWVTCDCGRQRAMSNAANINVRGLGSCDGARPWLGAGANEPCGQPNRLLIRSASNAYFSEKLSVISIPDLQKPANDAVALLWDDFLSDVETLADLTKVRRKPTPAAKLQGLSDADIMSAIERRREDIDDAARPIKAVEFEALANSGDEMGHDVPHGDFYARALPPQHWAATPNTFQWMRKIEKIIMVHRLREVVAQVGFTRFEAIGADIQGELSLDIQRASLSQNQTWVPAIENRGEGIFIVFGAAEIEDWQRQPNVSNRGQTLANGFELWRRDHPNTQREFSGLAYYLLHTFSHLLMSSIALECGYPASSLRERIYCNQTQHQYGVLIYTGASDAEGTLGGLIMAGRNIAGLVRQALEQGGLCSNDPVCAHHMPDQHDHQPLLGSACHGCVLISETSCEQHNEFLDRALVVSTVEDLQCEFFDELA